MDMDVGSPWKRELTVSRPSDTVPTNLEMVMMGNRILRQMTGRRLAICCSVVARRDGRCVVRCGSQGSCRCTPGNGERAAAGFLGAMMKPIDWGVLKMTTTPTSVRYKDLFCLRVFILS
jgi:hypothetical protein